MQVFGWLIAAMVSFGQPPLEEKKVRFGLVNCFLFVDLE